MRKWMPVTGTDNWQYVDDESSTILRHVAVRPPYLGEAGSTKYEVTGKGHENSKHDSLPDAMAAAEASLAS
ncbi:MAG TPA: hypothetical protein VNV42_05340 [Solirubrobacteraceae bacterium]|nr:hypothetical protein [Solirubrobacteraceae bacterium]